MDKAELAPQKNCGTCAHWNRHVQRSGVKTSYGVCMVRRGEATTFSPMGNSCDVVAANGILWRALPWDAK